MRTKNAKRLWPVPATLAVMALAAFLAFGLMATNGAQPAAAQSDDPCFTVTADDNATISSRTPTVPTDDNNADGADGCDSAASPAVVKLLGQVNTAATAVSNFVIYGPGIGGANTHVYPPDTSYGDHDQDDATDDTFYTGTPGTDEVEVAPLPGRAIQVGPGTVNLGGVTVGSSTTFTVAGTAPETVTIYVAQGTEFTAAITDAPETNGTASVALTDNRVADVNIIFLGAPALGKDGADFNRKLDDAMMDQCVEGTDQTSTDLVGEAAVGACATAGTALTPSQTWTDSTAVSDSLESRSKLVVRTGAANAETGVTTAIIDGKTGTHTLMTGEDTVTIYALLEDSAGKPLLKQEVSFRSTTTPTGIVAPRDLSDDVETESVISELPGGVTAAPKGSILVDGLEADDTGVSVGAIIAVDDAVASYTLDSLPSDPFNIEVEVMAGNLSLGTVEIARPGTPTKVVAGVFNIECFNDPNADGDYLDAKFDGDAMYCDNSGMANRFGRGDMFVVKAHHEDALDIVVGMGTDLSSKLANDDDDLLGDEDIVTINTPVTGKMMPRAWLFTIDDEASLGEHMITVSTREKDKDDNAIADVTLTVSVAGPPASYMLVNPVDTIPMGGYGMFTVQAYDAASGVPDFGITPATDNKVEVFIQGLPNGNTRGLSSDGMVTLDEDTGVGTFTIFAPNDAEDGDTVRIFVASGDMETQHEVMFGTEDSTTDDMLGTPMDVGTGLNLGGALNVYWTEAANATGYIVIAINRDLGKINTDVVAVATNRGGVDNWTITGLTPGEEYNIFVAATASGGEFELSEPLRVMAE